MGDQAIKISYNFYRLLCKKQHHPFFAIVSSIVLVHVNLSGCDSCIQYSRNLFAGQPAIQPPKREKVEFCLHFFFSASPRRAHYFLQYDDIYVQYTFVENRGERILFFGLNTNTNIIRNQNFDRIRIRIIFVFSE